MRRRFSAATPSPPIPVSPTTSPATGTPLSSAQTIFASTWTGTPSAVRGLGRLSGHGEPSPAWACGWRLKKGVWIGNGTVSSFATGVLSDNTRDSEVVSVASEGNFYGIYLVASIGSRLENNVAKQNIYGIHLQESNGNALIGNDSSDHLYPGPGGYGINLVESDDNVIKENVLAENLNQGIWLINSTGNLIFLNDLIGNKHNGVEENVGPGIGNNIWYNPGSNKGNYWSDYNGQDADGDGIGDTPHPIKGFGSGAEDRYPSVNPYRWKPGS